ncbi:MAG TPA: hypothetical protein VL137_13940 [Polyangiaceae bacterium]|jgi:hypothetical protein|nr:hypothetical protein [Polyangiaceae bacterium]
MENNKVKLVYVISERSGRNYWTKIGIAFQNADGSLNVKLEAIPVGGEMQIRDFVPKEDAPGNGAPRRDSKSTPREAHSA